LFTSKGSENAKKWLIFASEINKRQGNAPNEKMTENEKIGTEEAGRKERYKFFDQVAQEINANKIAIAHNLNDNAETVLMHLLRGSGITGLCGIKPDREGKYIRPIIKCERAEIEQYCKDQKLDEKYNKTKRNEWGCNSIFCNNGITIYNLHNIYKYKIKKNL